MAASRWRCCKTRRVESIEPVTNVCDILLCRVASVYTELCNASAYRYCLLFLCCMLLSCFVADVNK